MTDRAPDILPLAAEFPAATYEQWRKLVETAIKGATWDTLVTQTADGIGIEPLYRRSAGAIPLVARTPGTPWQIMQRIDHPNADLANAQALEDLGGGANGLVLVGAGAAGAHGYGLLPSCGVEALLAGVKLDGGIAIEFDLSPQTKDLPLALAALVKSRGIAPETLDIRFGFDPLGASALNGGFPMPWAQFATLTAELATTLAVQGFPRAIAVADGRIVHAAGGTEAQELAYVIAVALAYLRAFEAGGVTLDAARRMIFFRLAADADQFLTIAKFRALRKLWQRIEASCGLSFEPAFVAAETAWRTMTRSDPTNNILRAAIAAFSAGIGGADAVTVLPFTAACGLADAFTRRIARNTQLILLEEANIARIADPTSGTGWCERLTHDLCHSAWGVFQEIEAVGGAAAALERETIQDAVAAASTERQRAVETGTTALVGVNVYPVQGGETPVAICDIPQARVPAPSIAIPFQALIPMRLSAALERAPHGADRITTGDRGGASNDDA